MVIGEEMSNRLEASRLRYAPGTQWRYSTVGYLVVARLPERLTGLSLPEALTEPVLAPLAVSHVSRTQKKARHKGGPQAVQLKTQ